MTYALDHFYDKNSGMFYFTSRLDPELVARKMEINDNVIPASNSVMANVLYDLGTLLDQDGISVRTGHHCTQPLMKKLGITGTARVSFGVYNNKVIPSG